MESIDIAINQLIEFIPEKILYEVNLINLKEAILQIHYPKSNQDWNIARKRLAFDELFLIQLLVIQQKEIWRKIGSGIALDSNDTPLNEFLNSLPFELTTAQNNALNEILKEKFFCKAKELACLLEEVSKLNDCIIIPQKYMRMIQRVCR